MSNNILFINDNIDLNYYNSLKPHYKYRRLKFKFKCKHCGNIAIKNLESINNEFLCNSCSCSIAFKQNNIQEKKKCTCLIKYGTDNVAKSNIIKEKIKNTNIKKYGTDCIFYLAEFKNKSKETKQIKYGNPNFVNHEKAKETCIERYGVDNYAKTQECQDKINKTILERYGESGIITSKGEIELYNYINSIYIGNIIRNNRDILKGRELDIYLPDLKLGFEFDGTYWHADSRFYKENDIINKILVKDIWKRDKEKDILCENLNIQLIRVKEYDWINDSEIEKTKIKEIIENKLLFKNNY